MLKGRIYPKDDQGKSHQKPLKSMQDASEKKCLSAQLVVNAQADSGFNLTMYGKT